VAQDCPGGDLLIKLEGGLPGFAGADFNPGPAHWGESDRGRGLSCGVNNQAWIVLVWSNFTPGWVTQFSM
jgi:hypothetical protein